MGDTGYIVVVTKVCHSSLQQCVSALCQVDEIHDGKIRDGIAAVSFPVDYQALVFRPIKNEVVDGVVRTVEQAPPAFPRPK